MRKGQEVWGSGCDDGGLGRKTGRLPVWDRGRGEGCDVTGVVVKERVDKRDCSIMGWRIEEKYDTVIGLVGEWFKRERERELRVGEKSWGMNVESQIWRIKKDYEDAGHLANWFLQTMPGHKLPQGFEWGTCLLAWELLRVISNHLILLSYQHSFKAAKMIHQHTKQTSRYTWCALPFNYILLHTNTVLFSLSVATLL